MPRALALLLLCALASSSGEQTAAPPAPGVRHALLIGVTTYPNLDDKFQLGGPGNDVILLRKTLESRLGFNASHITELREGLAVRNRPTRANIERELVRLAADAKAGDQVLVFFAGHGSQQPDTDGDETLDGLDEIFLPRDVAGWDGTAGEVTNAIGDDQIGRWLTAIRSKGAFVWAMFDACQSTSLTRGGAAVERPRMVPMDVLVPADVIARRSTGTRGAAPTMESAIVGLDPNAGGIAALYAAQTTEPTPERELPEPGAPVHGLFTYSIVKVLEQSLSAITYRDLAERVTESYRAQGRVGPMPGFEGGGLDDQIAGLAASAARGRMLIGAKSPRGLELRAGSIHGLTRGTILRMFPPAGTVRADRPVGYVKVIALTPDTSTVEPVAFDATAAPAPSALVPGSRAEVASYDYGDQVLKIAMLEGSPALAAAIANLPKTTNGLAKSSDAAQADWIARVVNGEVVLAPASGSRIDSPPLVAADLAETVTKIARARNLLQLAAEPPPARSTVDVEIEMLRFKDDRDKTGATVPLDAGGRTLRPGDQVGFRIRNTGESPADVTLFFIDSQFGVIPIFPMANAEADNRVARGAEATTIRFTVSDETVGWEQVVAIAVEARNPRVDFRYLQQTSLQQARSGDATRGGPASGLQRLLDHAMFGQGTTRSLQANEVGRHAIKMLAWKTVADKKP